MGSMLNDAAMIEHNNLVGIADGGKTMGNDKCSASRHQRIHPPLYKQFGTRVDA